MDDLGAIRQLAARFAFAFDEGDVDGWLACWTPDGVLYRLSGESVTGHEALGDYLRGFPGRGRHVVTNSVTEVDGDVARHRAYVQYFDRNAGHRLVMFGVYHDEVARHDGTWRFSLRRAVADAAEPG